MPLRDKLVLPSAEIDLNNCKDMGSETVFNILAAVMLLSGILFSLCFFDFNLIDYI